MALRIPVGNGYNLLITEELFLLLNLILTTMIGIILGIGLVTLFH